MKSMSFWLAVVALGVAAPQAVAQEKTRTQVDVSSAWQKTAYNWKAEAAAAREAAKAKVDAATAAYNLAADLYTKNLYKLQAVMPAADFKVMDDAYRSGWEKLTLANNKMTEGAIAENDGDYELFVGDAAFSVGEWASAEACYETATDEYQVAAIRYGAAGNKADDAGIDLAVAIVLMLYYLG